MKKIKFMDTSFRDGFQSCYGARVKTEDFIPILKAAVEAGNDNFEIGGGARFQSLYFYCQEDAFDMMDKSREVVGKDINLQTLARGVNVVGLESQSRDIVDLHAKLFKKHGITTIRNFDALMDIRNLSYSGECITNAGLNHQIVIALMGLPPSLNEKYYHSADFYTDKIKEILKADIPFNSIAFKDASGTTPPSIVFESIKNARKLLPENTIIQFHTHDTAGMAVSCNMAAIEAGADIIDLAMSPVSGGTSQADILTMWQALRGTEYTLDIDEEKILEVEKMFIDQMDKYYLPPEAITVNPVIPFSPMPGGALTANTQMMRDNGSLNLFGKVIENMREVVEMGGFGTSVTPVSQFYFQQAFTNTVQEKWSTISESYGKMILGYFGNTPTAPDPEIMKIASKQLSLEPTKEDVHDLNDDNPNLGIEYNKKLLEDKGLETSEENIFISATCGDKGISYLEGNAELGVRYKTDESEAKSNKSNNSNSTNEDVTKVTVNGKEYEVIIQES